MRRRYLIKDTPKENKAWTKAVNKTYRLRAEADYALIRSTDDDIADNITTLVESIVRHNGRAKDYDDAFRMVVDVTFNLMRDEDE